jgi:hypothetical protein
LQDKSSAGSTLKIEALLFLKLVVAANEPAVSVPHVASLSPAVLAAAAERYYKVAAEALRCAEQFVRVVRPSPTEPAPPAAKVSYPHMRRASSKTDRHTDSCPNMHRAGCCPIFNSVRQAPRLHRASSKTERQTDRQTRFGPGSMLRWWSGAQSVAVWGLCCLLTFRSQQSTGTR